MSNAHVIGCTGTRNGMTEAQRHTVAMILHDLCEAGVSALLHGACRGVDAEIVAMFAAHKPAGAKIIAHPGVSAKGGVNPDRDQRSIEQSDEVLPAQTHFARNRAIVRACDLLVAVPPCRPAPTSGGTAYTIDFARSQGKPVKIVWPDGEVTDIEQPQGK